MGFLQKRKKLIVPAFSFILSFSAACITGNCMQAYAKGIGAASHTQDEIRKFIADNKAAINDELTFQQEPKWTAPYAAGRLSDRTQKSAVDMLNQIRYIAGISYNVQSDDAYIELAQASSLVNYANGRGYMSHTPAKPADMDEELYQKGLTGAGSSNIAWASWQGCSLNETLVMSWMEDGDSSNIDRVGHRRWLLNPKMSKTGFGAVSGSNGTFSSVYAHDNSNIPAGGEEEPEVAWPAQNMPVEYFSEKFPWSISLGEKVDENAVKVTLNKMSGTEVTETWEFSKDLNKDLENSGSFYVNNDSYGQTGCIIFKPNNAGSYKAGDKYQVTINITGKTEPITYEVDFFTLGNVDVPGTEKELSSISAVYTGSSPNTGSTVNKSDLLVKAQYSDGSQEQISDFDMVPDPCTIHEGDNLLTISYKGKTAAVTIKGVKPPAETISVRFDTQGGTPVNEMTIEKDACLNPLPVTTKDGYVFDGWYTDYAAGTKVTEDTKLTQHTILYAHWAENKITELKAEYLGKYLMAGTKEWIDKKDLRVTAVYLNGNTEEITAYSLDDYVIAEGDNVLTVRYGEYSAKVTVLGVSIKNIGVIYQGGPKPEGTTKLEDVDLNVMAELSNGDYIYKLTSYTIDAFVIHPGPNTLKVRLGGKEVSFRVTGQSGSGSTSSNAAADRITAQYNGRNIHSGSYINKSDIAVTAYFADGTSKAVTDFTIDSYRIVRGDNTITVRYGGQTASVTVVGDDQNGRITYQVLFDSQGGTSVEPMVVEAEDLIFTVPATAKAGATFQGWYTMLNGGGSRLTPVTRITQNIVYYAYWSDKTLTGISAYYNGELYAGTSVNTGLVVTANYADGTSERIQNYTLSKAVLTEGMNSITVSYDRFTANVSITAAQKSPETTPGSNGNTSGSNTSNGNTSNGNTSVNKPVQDPDQTPSYYVVNFHANGGTKLSNNKIMVDAGDVLDELPKVERRNYEFDGWYTSYSGGERVSEITPDESMTLFAHWSKIKKPAKASKPTLASKKKGQLKIRYKKVSGADGYQIGYSSKKDFSSGVKKVTASSTSKTINKLKVGKRYYVRVRAYKLDSAGKKVYGTYSTKKSIKIKK